MWAKRRQSGFTIVELLIVIVVIGILAAITIVAYNGIQTRAKNTKTISATNAWIKAIKLYEADNGSLPGINSCLGTSTTYPDNQQCWNSTIWIVTSAWLTLMAPYAGNNLAEPDITNIDSVNSPRRGALYSGGPHQIYMMLSGTNTCPDMNAPHFNGGSLDAATSGGRYCVYQL